MGRDISECLIADHTMYVGSDGSVDFDFVRINEETRQVVMLKNKGKFEIAYM